MKMIPFSDLDLPSGRVIEWTLRRASAMSTAPVFESKNPASITQQFHYANAEGTRERQERLFFWLGATFQISRSSSRSSLPVDLDALRAAFQHLVVRHEMLRAEFGMDGAVLQCRILAPQNVILDEAELGAFDDPVALRTMLMDRIDRTLDTRDGPLMVMGVVVGEERSVAYIAYDHLITDAISSAITANELGIAYEAIAAGVPVELPKVGRSVDFGTWQRSHCASLEAGDPRLERWRGFVSRNRQLFTEFPIDLQVPPGQPHPAANDTMQLLDEAESQLLERVCRKHDVSLYAGLTAATGIALHELCGVSEVRIMMPLAARKSSEWAEALGYLTNFVPLEFPVTGVDQFPATLRAAHTAFRNALQLADLPLAAVFPHVMHLIAGGRVPGPTYGISFIDYRKLMGAERSRRWQPTTFMRSSHSLGAPIWYFRTWDGVYMFSSFIDTPHAIQARDRYRLAIRRVLLKIAAAAREDVSPPSTNREACVAS